MKEIILTFEKINYSFPLVFVEGTGDQHFRFGLENDLIGMRAKDFFISKYPVTQIVWTHIMDDNPACNPGDNKPVENISFDEIVAEQGFLQKLTIACREQVAQQLPSLQSIQFRLPGEAEWEYAARGGFHWGNYFLYSGSDNIDEVGWYKRNSQDKTEDVGLKKPNQLGIYDMSGNIWEWCQDYHHFDTSKIPRDGNPCAVESEKRVLRGGCFHNFGAHCTVNKRYEIEPRYKDGCIGFRLAVSV